MLVLISALALGALAFLFFTIYRESRATGQPATGTQVLSPDGTLCDWLSPPATIPGSPATTAFGLLVKRQSAQGDPAPIAQHKVRIVFTASSPDAGRLVSVVDGSGSVDLSGQMVSTYDATTDADGLIAVTVTLDAARTATLQAIDLENGQAGPAIGFTAQ